jgi:hypothetical protein
MKIYEIISEGPLGDVGDIGQLTVNNVNKGIDAGRDVFSPTKWFKSKVVDLDADEPETTKKAAPKDTAKKQPQAQAVQPQNIRFALQKAAKGEQLYNDDVGYLKSAYGKVGRGTPEAEALMAAIKIQPLDKQQQAALLNLSKQY